MTKTKTPSIISQIVEKLYSEGSMKVGQMCETIKYPYKSVYTKALELAKLGLAIKDDDGVWSLLDGVTPQTLETGEIQTVEAEEPGAEGEEPGEGTPKTTRKLAPIARSTGIPLDQRGMFIKHCTDIGIAPKEAIPTIADIFFSGDIDSLSWLNQVLSKEAAGYVSHHQRRLMMSWWANSRRLDFDEEEYGFPTQGEGRDKKGGKGASKEEVKPEKRLDLGLGWKVGRDKDGAWIAQPGGQMSYQEAVDSSERRALIDSYGRGADEGGGEEGAEGEAGTAGRRKGAPKETMFEKMMMKMFESMIDGNTGKSAGDSDTVLRLTERIENMEREKNEDRMERMEGMVAQALARDPWEDYDRIEAMKQRLGGGSSGVTDSSPAVQLIKDTTDKADKNIARLVGLMERTVLRSDAFAPEETRNPKERESKAGQLLGEVQSRDRSRGLRKETFGI